MIQIYNSLSRKKEPFIPLDEHHVRLYACGPTVYDYAHIGNARMAVVFDLFARLLRSTYKKVTYVSNITDIDDKIIDAANKLNCQINEITQKFTRIYNEDMASLGVRAPDVQPLATDHIPEMIALIERLIDRGHAYAVRDDNTGMNSVMFHVPSDPHYGVLSGRSREDQIAGARVEISSFKKDPADFVLWKPSAGDQPGWESPWGFGRPGWHIECSAMTQKHLGLPFDLHGGGADLKFPHHENEIAQSCCAQGIDDPAGFSKYWMHNGFVTVEGEKMSKSLGNFKTAHELLEKTDGETLRFALMAAQYRQPLDWSDKAVHQAKKQLDGFYQHLYALRDIEPASDATVPEDIMAALCDDLNTPLAIGHIHAMIKNSAPDATLKGRLLAVGALTGLFQQDPAVRLGYAAAGNDPEKAAIEQRVEERQRAKKDKNYALADDIRKELEMKGIMLKDTPSGTQWRRV